MADMHERYRLLVLGSGQVGKTSIIRRYLYNQFNDRYKETVEDIFTRDFRIAGHVLPLDIYDTNFYYPDMRRVSISSANAFLLIFAVDNVNSFKDATDLFKEMSDRRPSEVADLPIVLVGNKSDAPNKKIYPETVQVWLNRLALKKSIPYLECSAKTNENIVPIFKSLLDQSGFPHKIQLSPRCSSPINRVGGRSPNNPRKPPPLNPLDTSSGGLEDDPNEIPPKSPTSVNEERISRLTRTLSRKEKPVSNLGTQTLTVNGNPATGSGLTRHGSLMRKTRLSLKTRHAAPDEPDESDCKIS